MKFAINVPNFGEYGDPSVLIDLAREAGLTWWQESLGTFRGPLEVTRARIRQGPPRTA